jgi:flavin-dependent dehydrogenase
VMKGMLLVGDAAAFVDPFIGDGISIALHTGKMAAQAIVGFPPQACDCYAQQYNARVIPALRMAGRFRRAMDMPYPLRRLALRLFANTGLGEYAVSKTRVRAA